MKYSIWFCALLFLPVTLSAQQTDRFTAPIESDLLAKFGEEYQLFIAIPADSVIGTSKGQLIWPLEDPYNSLQRKVLFAARNLDTGWVWGIYQEQAGQIAWTSEEDLECSDIYFYGAIDLNLDETVDIVVNCLQWSNTVVTGRLRIYSWDGTSGSLISDTTSWGGSRLSSTAHESFGYMDLNGDGIMEIKGLDPNDTEHWIYWSWNGEAYGIWPSTPSPPKGPFYPADMAEGEVKVEVVRSDTGFTYQYSIKSNSSSKRRIAVMHLDHGKRDTVGNAPVGWKFYGAGRPEYPLTWMYMGANTKYMIEPGEVLSEFEVNSSVPPSTYSYYLRSEHELPDHDHPDYSFVASLNDIRTNSDNGITLAPGPDPENLDHSEYADSLRSYLDFSCGNGWVTNHGICNSLQAKMRHVAKQLGKGKTKQAVNGLEAFISEVQAQRGQHITEEGYAVLYYNALYFKQQLQQQSGGKGHGHGNHGHNKHAGN